VCLEEGLDTVENLAQSGIEPWPTDWIVPTHVSVLLTTPKIYQGHWKKRPSQQLFKVFIYTYFAATCFGPRWPSSGGIHNIFRKLKM
jgi:hypothetical protein